MLVLMNVRVNVRDALCRGMLVLMNVRDALCRGMLVLMNVMSVAIRLP